MAVVTFWKLVFVTNLMLSLLIGWRCHDLWIRIPVSLVAVYLAHRIMRQWCRTLRRVVMADIQADGPLIDQLDQGWDSATARTLWQLWREGWWLCVVGGACNTYAMDGMEGRIVMAIASAALVLLVTERRANAGAQLIYARLDASPAGAPSPFAPSAAGRYPTGD